MKLNGNDVLLQFNMGTTGSPLWKDVTCIDANSLESASDEINGDSKCGIDRQPGDVSWTVPIGGFYELEPTATQISGQELIGIRTNKDFVDFRMRNATNTFYRAGNAYLSEYSEDMPFNELVKWTGTLSVKGDLVTVAPSS